MKLFLKILLFIILFISPTLVFSQGIKCEVQSAIGNTSISYLEKWINPISFHNIIENKVEYINEKKPTFLDQDKYIGKVVKNTDDKIVWKYIFKSKLIHPPIYLAGKGQSKKSNYFMTFDFRKKSKKFFF